MDNKLKYAVTLSIEKLSMNTPVLLRGDFNEKAAVANMLGYDAIELHLRNPEKLDGEMILECCKNNKINISAIATGLEYSLNNLSLISDNIEVRERAINHLKKHIELASLLNSVVIIGCIRGNIPENGERNIYWRRFDDAMLYLSDYAYEHGVVLVIESINHYVNNYLNSVYDTVSYISRLGRDNIKLHIDTHHMNIEDDDIVDAVRLSERYLGYVHFAGANRLYPSVGKIPYHEIQNELRRFNYSGYIGLECIPVPDPVTAAQRGLDYLKKHE